MLSPLYLYSKLSPLMAGRAGYFTLYGLVGIGY
jgi:hypothetical protein